MTKYLLRRLGLSLITLLLIITIIFVVVNILPGDIGRQLSGPFAPQEQVDALNEELGTNDPLIVQYGRLVKSTVTLDFGDSFAQNRPVTDVIGEAFLRSLKLAGFALIITIPLSIAAGVYAARRKDRFADRAIVTSGLASSSIPEFVSCVVLQAIAVTLITKYGIGWLHVIGNAPAGSSIVTQVEYLLLPTMALVIVYFGYIARMTRAGVIDALDSDFTRTAVMKGLSNRQVLRRHVLRNGLQPTVSVIGVQIGYVLGSLVAIEKVFNYPGLGLTLVNAASRKDLPVLQGGVLLVAIIYMIATLAADLVLAWMNPRARLEAA